MYAYNNICILTTIQKNARQPKRKSPKTKTPPPSELLRARFSTAQLLGRFHQLLPVSLLAGWLALSDQAFYARAFTPLITLWYLIFQRLSPNHHLSQVQEDALAGGADRLSPRGKRLSQQLQSEATTSFSDARQRLPLEVCRRTLWHSATQTHKALQLPQKFGLNLGLLDGSTCRLRPFGDIPEQFPPHRQQALTAQLLSERSWEGWLLAADRNFGVYSVARALLAAMAQGLLRLTEVRARKLARTAGLKLKAGLDLPINWVPTRHDQCPAGLDPIPVPASNCVFATSKPRWISVFWSATRPRWSAKNGWLDSSPTISSATLWA